MKTGKTPKGWHSRGYLPHCDFSGVIQGVTFRLHDAVPLSVIKRWKRELKWIETATVDGHEDHEDEGTFQEQRRELHRRLAAYEDAGRGKCYLRTNAIAEIVVGALRHFDEERYTLSAWCVMPNHVHVLFRPRTGWRTGDIIRSWKRYTAREANSLLGSKGRFWAPDYYDRYIRDEDHYWRALDYIHHNPVKASLCATPTKWRWSSAFAAGKKERGFSIR